MVVKFDTLNRFEIPKFHVCSPGSVYSKDGLSNALGCLSDTSDEELVMNFNTTSELSFRINLIHRDDPDEDAYVTMLYNSLEKRRMIFVEDIGYFVIDSVDDGYLDGAYYKDIQAMSCEQELQEKMLPFIDNGTYRFRDLFEKIVASLPIWKIGNVHDGIVNKHRTFEDVPTDTNVLSFLLTNMQDAYECIFTFDTINRVINVHDQNDYAFETEIHITKADVAKSIMISEGSEDLYTALTVRGDDNLNVSPINPLGSNTIYNFDHYLTWMSDGLREKLTAWQTLVRNSEDAYYNLNLDYYKDLTDRSNLNSEVSRIENQIDMYKRCKDSIVAEGATTTVEGYNEVIKKNGGIPVGIQDDIAETVREINRLIREAEKSLSDTQKQIQTLSDRIERVSNEITEIHESVSITDYFSFDEYEELSHYIYEGEYTDEYITVTESMTYSEKFEQMKTLYDRAMMRLSRVSKPSQEFSIDTENFVFVKEFEQWSDQLETGCLINVELKDDDLALLFLSSIALNYDDHSLQLTFGNRFTRVDQKSLLDGFLGDIKRSANSISFMKEVLYPVKNGEFDSMKEAISSSGILTKDAIMASKNQEFLIDDTGILGRQLEKDGSFHSHQVKITNKGIVFTTDSWASANTALGYYLYNNPLTGEVEEQYGLIANMLIGNMILSQDARIFNEKNSIILNEDGFCLTSNYTDPDEPVRTVFTIQKLVDNGSGPEYEKQMYIDTDGRLIVNGGIGVYTGNNVTDLEGVANGVFSDRSDQVVSTVTSNVSGIVDSFSSRYEQQLDTINARINNYEADIGQYMEFGESGLKLGASGSDFYTLLDNKSIAFYYGDNPVSWVDGNQLYIPNAVITTTMTLGGFYFAPRDDGDQDKGFSIVWQG